MESIEGKGTTNLYLEFTKVTVKVHRKRTLSETKATSDGPDLKKLRKGPKDAEVEEKTSNGGNTEVTQGPKALPSGLPDLATFWSLPKDKRKRMRIKAKKLGVEYPLIPPKDYTPQPKKANPDKASEPSQGAPS